MNADILLDHYDRIADAPDAIPRLRRFVLDLAVRGKLVPQDPADEPAAVTLRRLVGPVVQDGAFELPPTWCWVKVGDVAHTRLGKMLDKEKNKGPLRPYLRNINVRWFDFNLSDLLEMPFEDKELEDFCLKCGDVMICEGGEPGRAAVWRDAASGIYFQKAIHRVRLFEIINPDFFVYALKSSANDGRLYEYFTGSGIKHFTGRGLNLYQFPLPPLAEQRRIVAKVDELMALCDQLEAARTAREETRDRMAAASLARLNAPDPETFPTDARFALNALPALTTRPDQVKQLRQTILNLAVRGKLTYQDFSSESVKDFLGRLPHQRKSLELKSEKTIKYNNILGHHSNPNDLPHGWEYEALGRLTNPLKKISYGVLIPGPDVDNGVPFIRVQDLALSDHPPRPQKTISRDVDLQYHKTRIEGGEILICVVGSIGKLGIAPIQWAGSNIARAVARISLISDLNSEYIIIFLRSDYAQGYFLDATRKLAQPTLNVGLLEMLPVPIPPLAEQRRIVAKVNELMALCDQLEAALTAASTARARLLEAALQAALVPVEPLLNAAE
ncbi:restriction endonuclease subunit S [Nitrospirillum iridis]|uniref:Type I restriction enzyme S subunit n=1 Tax=Nitrospirillum iridis TaxID=765888 RepID=A0A7X0AVL0_9PROT|nr:restriction endonuclease subunit S [Nitrospirillum iridis]MBB6250076.1 type I restriction enzyme S subunit [Nitrospirillum iridis]